MANGINPAGWLWEDALDAAGMLVATGRAVPADGWVQRLKSLSAEESIGLLFGNL